MDTISAAEMRAIEAKAIESGQATGLELMERAGRGVVEAIYAEWPELKPELCKTARFRAIVLCGPGNNGGDGFVVARRLHEEGWQVDLYFYGTASKLPPDAGENYARWASLGPILPLIDAEFEDAPACTLVIDALFGIGISRPIRGLTHVKSALRDWTGPLLPMVVAVDVPSGLDADTGNFVGDAPHAMANLTVTFHRAKPGHIKGAAACGKVVIMDIGL